MSKLQILKENLVGDGDLHQQKEGKKTITGVSIRAECDVPADEPY